MKLSPHIDYLHSPNKSYGHVRQILYHQGVQGKGGCYHTCARVLLSPCASVRV
jgi:hypothetical protein